MIEYINDNINVPFALLLGAAKSINCVTFGVVEPIVTDKDGGQTLPAIVDEAGEVNSKLFDDRYAVGLYHRFNSKSYSEVVGGGYGDGKRKLETYDMSCVVYGKREAISYVELEEMLSREINKAERKKLGERVTSSVRSVLFDREQVFNGEYKGVRFFLPPNVFLFRINYTITIARTACN